VSDAVVSKSQARRSRWRMAHSPLKTQVGDAKRSLGDAKSSLGDTNAAECGWGGGSRERPAGDSLLNDPLAGLERRELQVLGQSLNVTVVGRRRGEHAPLHDRLHPTPRAARSASMHPRGCVSNRLLTIHQGFQ
jgi:hypothetical protein